MFEVVGTFRVGKDWMKFRKVVNAHNERFALEKVYSLLGSNHKVKRNLIRVESIRKVE
ncbi:50S ribosomal protein L18Ae [Archaeoglobus veneficus]|uniref:Large ribosomal subunit protein eL20 n=1 Tax=Archaeoglobus veneficus (strain DSM 11195 / SNP6) TaxID=693661 RepID=F2KQV6_ARCVS|nr:50S ribosomal protein L18Ae [Archaeoglobus veneficus]AEA47762.1 ribosomal LX protein [Archaeoglobus veneficus SNP6]